MARTVVIATRNRKKFEEMAVLLGGLDLEVRSLADFPGVPTVPETGDTFEENAKAKALGYAQATGQWALADDSGLEVDALGGRPGVRSSRWGGEEGNDDLNNRTLLEALADHPKETWTARYRCVVALATPDRVLLVAEGACEGRITDRPAGANGFGYDPYFFVPSEGRTMAQLAPSAKNRLSHRGRAIRALKRRLKKLL
ncbi:MAG: XTP/dITP diphosphatase [Planctomycetota bacterium]|nr:XTP/dITP diphosphatase [Planctomycetota bacterium]